MLGYGVGTEHCIYFELSLRFYLQFIGGFDTFEVRLRYSVPKGCAALYLWLGVRSIWSSTTCCGQP